MKKLNKDTDKGTKKYCFQNDKNEVLNFYLFEINQDKNGWIFVGL